MYVKHINFYFVWSAICFDTCSVIIRPSSFMQDIYILHKTSITLQIFILSQEVIYNEQTLPIDFRTYLRESDTATGAVNSYSVSFIL